MRNIIDSKVLQVVFGLIRFASITISQTIDDIIVHPEKKRYWLSQDFHTLLEREEGAGGSR